MIKKNPFIVIEGIDASGKETISKMLAEKLQAKLYSFPNYETSTGKLIQEHLQGKWKVYVHEMSLARNPRDILVFQALQAANRLEAAPTIQHYLDHGHAVVCDRYTVSGEVYGAADGLDPVYLEKLFSFLPQPDITFLLDIPEKESFRRRPDRGGDRYEMDKKKLGDVRRRYLDLFKSRAVKEPGKWIVLDGLLSPKTILDQILETLRSLIQGCLVQTLDEVTQALTPNTFEIWVEGYRATGEHGTARLLGVVQAPTFEEAVKKLYQENPEKLPSFNPERLTSWDCRLFDNETAARKAFG